MVALVEDMFSIKMTEVCVNFEQQLNFRAMVERSFESPYSSLETRDNCFHLGVLNTPNNKHRSTNRKALSWKRHARNYLLKSLVS